MKSLYYVSRNYVEFGGFTPQEISDFAKRKIIRSSDFVRLHDTDEWLTLDAWIESTPLTKTVEKPAVPKAKKVPAKKDDKKDAEKPKKKKDSKSKD